MSVHASEFSIADRFTSHLTAEEERGLRRLWVSVIYQMVYSAFAMGSSIRPFEVRAARDYLTSTRNKDRDSVLELAGLDPDSWRAQAIPRLQEMFAQGKSYSNQGKGKGCKGTSNAVNSLFSDLSKLGRPS